MFEIKSRPIPDTFRALEEICTAILESRLTVETTIETNGGKFIVKNRIVVDPAS
jgi:hypothetical protein